MGCPLEPPGHAPRNSTPHCTHSCRPATVPAHAPAGIQTLCCKGWLPPPCFTTMLHQLKSKDMSAVGCFSMAPYHSWCTHSPQHNPQNTQANHSPHPAMLPGGVLLLKCIALIITRLLPPTWSFQTPWSPLKPPKYCLGLGYAK